MCVCTIEARHSALPLSPLSLSSSLLAAAAAVGDVEHNRRTIFCFNYSRLLSRGSSSSNFKITVKLICAIPVILIIAQIRADNLHPKRKDRLAGITNEYCFWHAQFTLWISWQFFLFWRCTKSNAAKFQVWKMLLKKWDFRKRSKRLILTNIDCLSICLCELKANCPVVLTSAASVIWSQTIREIGSHNKHTHSKLLIKLPNR